MLLTIIKQLNWVDIFVIILLIRTCYIATKNGFPAEFFKALGTALAVYLSAHYYIVLSNLLSKRIGQEKLPLEFLDFLCFFFLAILGYLALVLLREAFCRFIKIEAVPGLNKWGALLLGGARSVLLSSLIIVMLFISSIDYLKESVSSSYLGKRLFKITPAVYSRIWFGLTSKFMDKEKFNPAVSDLEKNLKP